MSNSVNVLPRLVGAGVVDRRPQKDNSNLQSFRALLRRQVDKRGFQAPLCRSSASSRAWELGLVSGVGVSRRRVPAPQYTRRATICLTHGDYKVGAHGGHKAP